ncbi:MAG: IS1595 family transposase [Xanthomonadaceae bacterium]|nr:IS1595 family transposase [Xanthomonadaceae bacterium]
MRAIFVHEYKAIDYLESIRWKRGRVCPKCGARKGTSPVNSSNHRYGFYYCNSCKKTFTVTIGTIFENSRIKLNTWLYVFHLMVISKKGISAKQIERMIKVSYKTAWYMCHRVREAMEHIPTKKLGGEGNIVEVDETYWGNKRKKPFGARGFGHKMKIVSIVEREGSKRSFHVPDVKAKTVIPILKANIDRNSRVMTDDAKIYRGLYESFQSHESVNHSAREYARGDVTTNTVESSFAIVKRTLYGTHHHVSEKHLPRYLNELDFKWDNRGISDTMMMRKALKGAEGKRLSYWELKS